MSFYIAIIAFITSVIAGILSMIAGKNIDRRRFILFATMHGMLLFSFLASLMLTKDPNAFNYFFMAYICSGIILSGLAWRSFIFIGLKIYFGLFALTIGMFILSPSMLVNFLLTTRYTDSLGESFHVTENFYIERQNTKISNDSFPHYKLIRKRGIFHSSLQRDIIFNGKLDSIKVIEFDKSNLGLIRGYTSIQTFVSTKIDSVDVEIVIKKKSNDGLEYKL